MERYFQFFSRYFDHYRGMPRSCWEAIILTLFESTASGINFFMSLYFVNTLNFTVETAGWIITCFGFGTAVGGLLGGKFCDYFRARQVTAICIFAHALAFFVLLWASSVFSIFLIMFLMGVASFGATTACRLWIIDSCAKSEALRLQGMNISYAAANVGMGVSGVLVGLLAGTNIGTLFFGVALLLLFAGIWIIFPKNILSPEKNEISSESPALEKFVMKSDAGIFILVLVCLCAAGFFVSQGNTTYPLFLENIFPAMGVRSVSILFVLNTLAVALFQAPLVGMLKNTNKLLVSGVGVFLMGAGYLILAFVSSFLLAIVSCLVNVLGEMLFFSVSQLLCYEKAPESRRGQVVGIYQAVYALSRVFAPAAGAYIYQQYGGSRVWLVSGIVGFICLLFCVYYRQRVENSDLSMNILSQPPLSG